VRCEEGRTRKDLGEKPPFGGFSFCPDNKSVFENRRFPLPSDIAGPFDIRTYSKDVPLNNNNPTVPKGVMYETIVHTPLYRPMGRITALPGKYTHHRTSFFNG
jgi:hypothetical protein